MPGFHRTLALVWLGLFFIVLNGCIYKRNVKGAGSQSNFNSWIPDYKIHRDVLSNGLTVLYVVDRTSPVVSYSTWFKVGSAWEKPGSTGIAHLFEHLMFKGTPRYGPKEFFRLLESKGALVNAFTQRDATVYYEVFPSENLELVIDMESDRLANIVFSQKDLDAEREVVKEERRLRVESNFHVQQMEVLERIIFPNHPYGWPIIGYPQDLERLTLEECTQFFKAYYQPANAIIVIAGDFDYPTVRQWMQKYYGSISGRTIPKLQISEPKNTWSERHQVLVRPVENESLLVGYPLPSMHSPDYEKLSMLAWALFGMESSRGHLDFVREKKIALRANAEALMERFGGLFLVSIQLKKGQTSQRALMRLDELIEEIRIKPMSDEEINRVKNKILYTTINNAKSPQGVANWLASGEFYWNDYRHVFGVLDRYQAVTSDDLIQVAQKYLNKENRVVVIMKDNVIQNAKMEGKK